MACKCCGGCYRCFRNGVVDCQFDTKAECEQCDRKYACFELLQTLCDGTCPGGGLGPLATITVRGQNDGCYGWIEATGTATIGCGKVISATVTDGGSGFAKLGRAAPTLAASINQSGVTLDFSGAACGSWAAGTVAITDGVIVSASVTNGGSGYAKVVYDAPTLTATVSGGTGGVLSINGYSKIVGGMFDGYYVPTGISVVSGGSGYTNNAPVTLSLGTGDEWAPGSGAPDITIRTKADPPADEWTLTPYLTNGSGLVVSLTLEQGADIAGYGPMFYATAATVVNGGTGYAVDDEIDAAGSTTLEGNPCAVVVSSVDSNGAVTGLDVIFTGYHEGVDTGVITSVVISSNRASRKRTIAACDVPIAIVQQPPATGSGAEVKATVEVNESSPNFGMVTALTVVNGGSGYAAGSGAELSVTLEPYQGDCGFDAWQVASINVDKSGSGYLPSDTVTIKASAGDTVVYGASATIEVDEDGGITAVPVGSQGRYYRDDAKATPHLENLTVTVQGPSISAATVVANVNDDPGSASFGKVTSFSVTDGGSGYVALCERNRPVADCTDCPQVKQPESSTCYVSSAVGVCGEWKLTSDCAEPVCCQTCLAPRPGITACVPTLNVQQTVGGYAKASYLLPTAPQIDQSLWNQEWLQAHAGCNLFWVEDRVEQTNAGGPSGGPSTGTFCANVYFPGPDEFYGNMPPGYVPPEGCYLDGGSRYCAVYTIRTWIRYRAFIADCKNQALTEVTSQAFNAPLEYVVCTIPARNVCNGGVCVLIPWCGPPEDFCLGQNPGFLNVSPTLECPP